MNSNKTKIGLFSIGLNTYWDQFPGLLSRLEGYRKNILKRISNDEVEVIDAQMVDTVEKARTAGDLFNQENVSLIFLYVSTYALSSTVLPAVQKVKVPGTDPNMYQDLLKIIRFLFCLNSFCPK